MRAVKVFSLVFLVCAGLSLFPGDEPVSLIRIPKNHGLSGPLLGRLQLDVRQELETCFLAMAGLKDLTRLRLNGVRFDVVERSANGKPFLLVPIAGPGALDSLRALGRVEAVEPRTAIFWTDTGRELEALPAGMPRKALSPQPVRIDYRTAAAVGRPVLQGVGADPLVEMIVSLVSSADVSSRVQSLQDFQTRYASTSNCEAAGSYLFNAFSAMGLDDVRFQPFTFSGFPSRNVVAEKTGDTFPDDVVIICAHYDSTSPSATRLTQAPGADDNASGTAAVLEAARILAAYPLDFTVRFLAFSAEEWGLHGSRAYAVAARQAGERIVGVINLDMIAYADAMPEDLEVVANPASSWLADRFLAAASEYAELGATKIVNASFIYSDHSPFWDQGYPALLAIEDIPLANPYYHQTSDTLDKLNLEFLTSAARASLGLLAELAQPIREGFPRTPAGLRASSVVYSSLFNALKVVRLTWSAQADAAGYNIYRTYSPHVGYVKVNGLPVTGTAFTDEGIDPDLSCFYVVTAIGATGLESNRSREIEAAAGATTSATPLPSLNLLRLRGRR